jgi:hypothetical protein
MQAKENKADVPFICSKLLNFAVQNNLHVICSCIFRQFLTGLLFGLVLHASANAQIVMTFDTYPFGAGDTTITQWYEIPVAKRGKVSTGTGQTWDFSDLTIDPAGKSFITLNAKPRQDIFQNATEAYPFSQTFLVLAQTGHDYYYTGVDGYARVGRDFNPAKAKLSATDSIRFDAQVMEFGQREYRLKFPV